MFFAQLAKRRLLLTLPFLLLAMVQFAPAAGLTGHARAASLSSGSGNSGTIKISEDTAYQPPTGGSNEPHVTCPFWIQGYYFPGDHGTLSVTHCTIAGNVAAGDGVDSAGGGIANFGALLLTGSTVSLAS